MTDTTSGVARDIGEDLAALRRDISRMTEALTQLVRQQGDSVTARAGNLADTARAGFADVAAEAQKGACAAGTSIGSSIERNPVGAVMVAFGIGLSLALISRART